MAAIKRAKNGKWRVRVRRKGYPLRTASFDTKPEAQAWARSIEGLIDKGQHVDTAEAASTTLGDALARYLREETPKKKGAKQERVRILAWEQNPLAARPLNRVRGGDLADYRDARALGITVDELHKHREDDADLSSIKPSRRKVGGNTIRLELAVISVIYTTAREEWKLEGLQNPVLSIRKPKLPKARTRRLNLADKARKRPDEETLLLEHADPIMRQVIILAIETCMRRGELASITRDQIDRKKRLIHLDETKNGDSRDVPLSTRALQALKDLPARTDGTLLGKDADNVASWISHTFEDICDAAEIVDLHYHDLRREGISRLFEQGWAIEQVRAVSGHKTLQQLMVYTRLRGEDLAKKLG